MVLESHKGKKFFLITNHDIGKAGHSFATILEDFDATGVWVKDINLIGALAETTAHRKEDLVREEHRVFIPYAQIKALVGPVK